MLTCAIQTTSPCSVKSRGLQRRWAPRGPESVRYSCSVCSCGGGSPLKRMRSRRLRTRDEPEARSLEPEIYLPQRMKKLLIACGLFLVIAALLGAQARPPATDPFTAARKALNLGQYEQVASLLGNSNDPRAIALRARVDVDHGRYAEAEKLLASAAASA